MIEERVYDLIQRLEEDSNALGIPSISREDGTLLAALAFSQCSSSPGIIVDAGAGIGYSTAWLVLGSLRSNCEIIAIEYDSRLYSYLANASRQLSKYVKTRAINDNALNVLTEISGVTLLFVDIEKRYYPDVLRMADKIMKPNGILAFHNAFFPRPPEEFFLILKEKSIPHVAIPTLAGGMMIVRMPA